MSGPLRARKRFGQHFLHDPAVLERIVRAVAPAAGERLVEIGPGRGALTRRLLETRGASLDAIEIDRDLAALLRAELGGRPGFALHECDALRLDFAALARSRGGPLRIVGNLPYNISTPLLFHLLESVAHIADMHLMLQREVVDRMVARPGEADYSRLSVMLAPWVRIERLFEVGPGAFQPAPRVWSAVARLTVRPEPAFVPSASFARVVAAAFAQRRKQLRNSLRSLLEPGAIERCGIDPAARPETLPPEAFDRLARRLDHAGTRGVPVRSGARLELGLPPDPDFTRSAAMSIYRRILLVVDLTEDSLAIGRRAQALARSLGAEVELLHVVEFVPVEPMGETLMPAVQIEEELLERARQRLAALATELGIPGARCQVEAGNVKSEIVRIARERASDLIVLGCRERHGLSILVNLTEDTVLHAAPCDVLAVRLGSARPG